MSTKTLRKRIALVAVSAMGFGLLTSVGAQAAWVDTAPNGTLTDDGSTGLVGPVAGSNALAETATILNTGTLKVASIPGSGGIIVSSGAAISEGGNNAQTCAEGTTASVIPTGAAGSTFTVSVYSGGSTCADGLTTLVESITVTIASSSQAGTASAKNSSVAWVSSFSDSQTSDVANKSSALRGGKLYLNIKVKDVYNAPVTTGGALLVEVSDGAVVNTADSAGTYTTAVKSTDPSSVFVRVDEKKAGNGWAGTVKVSYNGVLLATKSGKITGDVSKITTSLHKVGDKKSSPSNTADIIRYQAYDSAGNIVALLTPSTTLLKDSSSNPAVVSAVLAVDADVNKTDGTSGKVGVTCSDKGSSDVVLYYVNEAGTIVKSNPTKVLCGGDAYTYSASFDKSTYKQGDIATLTVKFFDSKGNAANSVTVVSDATTADQVITAPQMVRVTDASGYSKGLTTDATGAVTYTFTVGTDSGIAAGTYNAVVSFPTVNTNGAGENQSVTYTITSGGTSISNAEVLAAIVKLIASINKQITALQKLLTKKK